MGITILYTALIIIAGLLIDKQSPTQRRNYIVFVAILLTLVAGLRSIWVGTDDTLLYYSHFLDNINKSVPEIWEMEGKDPFYYVFQKILSNIVGNDYQRILIVCAAFFAISSGYLIYKESANPLVSYIILLSMGFFFFSMNGLRQALAIGVLFFAYFSLKNRRFISFLCLVVLASAFHKTAAIFILAYPAVRGKLNFTTILLYIVACACCLMFGKTVLELITEEVGQFDERLQVYQSMSKGLTTSGLIQLLLFGVFAFSKYKRVLQADPKAIFLYILLIFAILAQSMATVIAEMFRIAMYFSVFLVVLIPKVLDTFHFKDKRMVTFSLSIALLIYFFFLGTGRIPHHFYFESRWEI